MEQQKQYNQIPESKIDKLGHIINSGRATIDEQDPAFNDKIDVFSAQKEGDRAQLYQMYAIETFAENEVAFDALEQFGLAGASDTKERWTQLLEHVSGVAANAKAIEQLLEKYGAEQIDMGVIEESTLYDSLQRPDALETAVLIHDTEKPAELAATGGGGLENSRDNPVLREGKLWTYLHQQGVRDEVILAAQNTGRSDRFFSEYGDYDESALPKAAADRASLASLTGKTLHDIDAMSPTERRRLSIESKGRVAAIVGLADAVSKQFRFQGVAPEQIDAMSAHYLTYKKDPESVMFFGQDWPEYYKQVHDYLVDQVPEQNRAALARELDAMTEQDVFDGVVLPTALGATGNKEIRQRLRYNTENQ